MTVSMERKNLLIFFEPPPPLATLWATQKSFVIYYIVAPRERTVSATRRHFNVSTRTRAHTSPTPKHTHTCSQTSKKTKVKIKCNFRPLMFPYTFSSMTKLPIECSQKIVYWYSVYKRFPIVSSYKSLVSYNHTVVTSSGYFSSASMAHIITLLYLSLFAHLLRHTDHDE